MTKKVSAKILATAECGYIYAIPATDGTTSKKARLVLTHSQTHAKAGIVSWVTIHDFPNVRCDFTGRLVLHSIGMTRLLQDISTIRAREPSIERGSDNTKKLGIAYGYVNLIFDGYSSFDGINFPLLDCVSGDLLYQPAIAWTEPNLSGYWGDYKIAA